MPLHPPTSVVLSSSIRLPVPASATRHHPCAGAGAVCPSLLVPSSPSSSSVISHGIVCPPVPVTVMPPSSVPRLCQSTSSAHQFFCCPFASAAFANSDCPPPRTPLKRRVSTTLRSGTVPTTCLDAPDLHLTTPTFLPLLSSFS